MSNKEAVYELENLREMIRERDHSKYVKDFIDIGDFSYGVPNVYFWDDKTHLTIGKFCSIAENVSIMLGGEHRTDWVSTYPFNALMARYSYIKGHPATKGDIVIGNDVWIGSGVKILSGVTIGDGAVIGANTLVSKDVPDYYIAVGAAGGKMRPRFDSGVIRNLCEIKWWNWDLEDIANIIPMLQSEDINAVIDYYFTVIAKTDHASKRSGHSLKSLMTERSFFFTNRKRKK